MPYLIGAVLVIIVLCVLFTLPGSIIAQSVGQCGALGGCSGAVWTDSFVFWLVVAAIVITLRSRRKQPIIASYEGKDFRLKDRVAFSKNVLPDGNLTWLAEPPEKTGHHCEVRVDPGRIGTIVGGIGTKRHARVRWDPQEWIEYDGAAKVHLAAFESTPHVEYLEVI